VKRFPSFTQLAGLALIAVLAMQIVPYGRNHRRPSDGQVARFDSPQTENLARRACFDCHSNQTKWPWYASIAPVSWRIQNHVDEGREALNFSALDTTSERGADAAGEAAETVRKGEMPPVDYLLMHPEARLDAAQKDQLARGLGTMFSAFAEREGKGEKGQKGEKDEDRD
jgi:hypothetical protein